VRILRENEIFDHFKPLAFSSRTIRVDDMRFEINEMDEPAMKYDKDSEIGPIYRMI